MTKLSIELILSAEDRDAITAAVVGQLDKAKAAAPKAEEPKAEDDFENTEGAADDFEAEAEPEITFTKGDVQDALRAYAEVSSKAEAMKLIKTVGKADGLSALKDENFAAVIDAAKKALAKAKK